MKNLLLFSVLLILLPAVINSQSYKERLAGPFRTISKEAMHEQMFGKEQAIGIELPGVIQKNKKANKISSVSYRPTIVTCKDSLRYTYTYNSSGKCLTELDEKWTNNAWVNFQRNTYTYDNSGNDLTHLVEAWTNNAWVNSHSYIFTYTYDNSGNIEASYQESWINNALVNSFRALFTYDNSGNELTDLGEIWANNAWVNYYRYTYSYDNSGNMLTSLFENYVNNVWVISYRHTYTYDNSGNLLSYIGDNWSNNILVNSNRATYTYDNLGNRVTYLGEAWTNNAWVNSYMATYTRDNSGNLLTYILEAWTNNAWVNYDRFTYTFDDNGNCIHGEIYGWQNSSWVPYFGSSSLMYNHNKDSWYGQFSVVDLEYATFTGIALESTGVQSFNLLQNFPNPFNPSTTINYSLSKEGNVKLTVFNAIGSKVATIVNEYKPAGNYSVHFNGSNLASGIYLYKLESGNYSAVKKFILMK
jgi:hypothetical protein